MIRYVAFGIVIDDIAFADGRQFLGLLGGGGPQAAFGMRLWSESVGLVGAVGQDWPQAHRAQLETAGIDLRGVLSRAWPTLRAWQLYDAAGVRRHEWQVGPSVERPDMSQCLALAPPDYHAARGYHIAVHPETPDLDLTYGLQARGSLVSLGLFRRAVQPPDEAALQALVAAPDILSLNLDEGRSLCAAESPEAVLGRLVAAGGRVVVLRLGEQGALIADTRERSDWQIAAFPLAVIDPTGAGDAFSGAFMAVYAETGDALLAGLWGSVAASFMVESIGCPILNAATRAAATQRLERLRATVRRIRS
jgi:sugar/nucleoside kinase (ribokinase family)